MIMLLMMTILVIIILPSHWGGFNETYCDKGVVTIKGYAVQYNSHYEWLWASWVAQLVKNLPAMQETWIKSLGLEDPLEEGKATHSSILAWRIPMDRGA